MTTPTKKQLASRHQRRLRTMGEQITAMSLQWEDLDQFCVNALKGLAETVEVVSGELLDEDSGKGTP